MNNQDYIAGIFKKLQSLSLGNTPVATSDIIEIWAECLEDVKPEIIALGYKYILKNGTESGFFPSAPEFRKICLQFTQDRPELKLEKAWKAFKNYVPNLQGAPGEKQAELLQNDPALRKCIDVFHSDWSLAAPETASYWYKNFADAYLRASQSRQIEQIEESRKALESPQSITFPRLMKG